MKATIQARLNEEAQAALDRLVKRDGLNTSEAVREALLLLDKHRTPLARPRMIGIGMYSSGIGDLATNKKYMEGFGAKGLKRGLRK